ncbi:MAG TPA: CvpA family protein [Bacillota bacterium]
MLDFIIFILLLLGLLIGLKRGFILQVFHLVGLITAFIVAILYYKPLASKLSLWIPYPELTNDHLWADFLSEMPLEHAFYHAVSFAIIFFATKIILQIVATMLDFIASIPILRSVNKIGGAILGFLEVYVILFIVLYILALTPVQTVQTWLNHSSLAFFMLEHTPYFSSKLLSLWMTE